MRANDQTTAGRRKRRNYTLNEFPRGRGRIKCAICGVAIRDHEGVGPCPFAEPGELKVRDRGRLTNKGQGHEGNWRTR